MTRLVDHDWAGEFDAALRIDASELRIICPFIKASVMRRLLAAAPGRVRVITRFDLNDFAQGVSDIAALEDLLQAGAQVRGVIGLHAKSYVFGNTRAFVTSANLTQAALNTNHEFGLVSGDAAVISACQAYFEALWPKADRDLTAAEVAAWRIAVADRRAAARPKPAASAGLRRRRWFAAAPHGGGDARDSRSRPRVRQVSWAQWRPPVGQPARGNRGREIRVPLGSDLTNVEASPQRSRGRLDVRLPADP